MTSVNQVESYRFSQEEGVFLDANIWLYIYGPNLKQDWKIAVYSRVLQKILDAKSQIYIDIVVLSEFIHAYTRMEWKAATQSKVPFKDYRRSPQFPKVARAISANAKRLLSYCTRIESEFCTVDVSKLISDFATGEIDFNDQHIVELCRAKNLKLITHDADFRDQDIPILTANQRLLQ